MPYITIHAQRKARAIWKLARSIELTDSLFVTVPNNANNDDASAANDTNNMNNAQEEDVDSDDEMEDEGEELIDVPPSLVSVFTLYYIHY